MSFEGYYQKLCKNGHLWEHDCMEDEDTCPQCGEEIVWSNLVDQTNGMFDEDGNQIDGYVELDIEKVTTIPKTIMIEEVIYSIPIKGRKT